MWCIKCGKQIKDGSRFCGYCGATQTTAPSTPPQPASPYAPTPQRKETNKAAMIVWIIASILIVAAIALVLIFVVFPNGIGNNSNPAAVEDRDDENEYSSDDTEAPDEDAEAAQDDEDTDVVVDEPTEPSDNPDEASSELQGTGYDVGDVMYDFSLPTIDGGTFTLSENLGKPIFINIFATWCGPCVSEMPHIEELYQEYGDYVTFIIIDAGEGLSEAQGFANDNGYTLPFAYSEYDSFIGSYSVDFVPQTFVLDATGTIVAYIPGSASYEEFESAVTQALGVS